MCKPEIIRAFLVFGILGVQIFWGCAARGIVDNHHTLRQQGDVQVTPLIKFPSLYRVLDSYPPERRVHPVGFPEDGNDDPECRVVVPPPRPDPNKNISLWELLEDGRDQLELSNSHKDVIMFMGNTGSGKSTLTHLIAGDPHGMELVQNPSGDFLIIDENDKIGQTTASKTLIPELIVDNETSLALYDCPGFDDNRGADTDITANFLLKAVTDHVSSISIAFVVLHSSVSGTNDKTDFDRMTTHAVNLVEDLLRYDPGIGLVISKAPNFNPSSGRPITDKEIMTGITSFLNMYKADQEGMLNELRVDRSLTQRKIQFVEILLKEGRIWFMRLANRCGLLSDDPVSMETRNTLRNLITKNLTLVPSLPKDFGWALTGNTLLQVVNYTREINQNITTLGTQLVTKIRRAQDDRISEMPSFNNTRLFLQAEHTEFSAVLKILQENQTIASSPKFFASEILRVLEERKYDPELGTAFNKAMVQLDEYLGFFEDMSDNPIQRDTQNWIKPFKDFIDEVLGKRNEWYEFLQDLQRRLGEYSFQKSKPAESVPTKPNLDYVERQLGIPVTSRIRDIFNTNNLLTDKDTRLMKIIIDIAMERSKASCATKNKMIITGGYVLASEFINTERKYFNCSNIKDVEIFATQKLFMDRKLRPDYSEAQQLAIVAPFFEITADALTIELDGHNGVSSSSATDGKNGDVGLPGDPGGNFYAVIGAILSGNKLKITANGGNGGDGASGINGKKGDNGKRTNFDDWPSACFWVPPQYFDWYQMTSKYYFRVKMYGGPGGEGLPGGDGGISGQGGYGGKTELLQIDHNYPEASISQETKDGVKGTDGKEGTGGQGGDTGDGMSAKLSTNFPFCGYSDKYDIPGSEFTKRKGADGRNGKPGGNTIGQKSPQKPTFSLEKFKLINDYKAFVYTTEIPEFPNNFLKILEESPEIEKMYDPVAFAQELLNLEYYSLSTRDSGFDKPLALSRYTKFMERIEDFTARNKLSSSDKKIFAILYTTALSKLHLLTRQLGSTIVINVGGYLKSVLKRFDRYQETQTQVVVNEQRQNYASGYEEKIEQSLFFIEDVVGPGITKVERELQSTGDELVVQIIKMQQAVENEVFEAKKTLEKIQNQMAFRHLFSALKIGSTFISMMGAQGAAIGGVIGSLTNVGEEFAMGDYSKDRPKIELPPSIKGHADKVEADAKKDSKDKLEEIKALLSVAEEKISQNLEVMGDMRSGVKSLAASVQDVEENGESYTIDTFINNMDKIISDHKALIDSLDTKETSLNELASNPSTPAKQKEDAKKGSLAVSFIKNSGKVIDLGLEIYKKYKDDAKELERLAKMVDEAEKAVKDVKAYKESVYSTLMPMVSGIAADLQNVTESLGTQTSVSLAVSKWQVQSTLSDYRFFLRQFTDGLPQQEKFAHCVDKLSEAMSIMIDLYDYIQTYNDHMKFADYLANLNSPSAIGITINNPEAMVYLNKIELALQSNILLDEYDRAIVTFEQWIFPFAHLYMEDFTLPKNMSDFLLPSSDISSPTDLMLFQIPVLQKRIRNLDQRMEDYKSLSFDSMDVNLIKLEFNSSLQSSHPFFVWKNKENVDLIRDLLMGKRVTFKADPTYAYENSKSAVKFRLAELVPKGINPEVDVELEKVLKDFTMIMTHSGVSHYIYADEPYSMVGDNATLRYNYERDSDGNRVGPNEVYEKVKKGDFIMSPYTMWTAQIIRASNIKRIAKYGFSDLGRFADHVDLELVGIGTYVDERQHDPVNKMGLEVFHYYAADQENADSYLFKMVAPEDLQEEEQDQSGQIF